ncbi:MAG: hypothetical protein LC687_00680 [Actinobacteria bacterium]|nr:hypothetical protein [Actinomycetota bacterium]
MTTSSTKGRARLLSSVCMAALALSATQAASQTANVTGANAGISVNQTTNAFGLATNLDVTSIIDPVIEIDIEGIVEDDTLLVGGIDGNRNILSAIGAGNEANSEITSTVTNDLIGVSLAQTAAIPTVDAPATQGRTRAASDSFANLAIGVSQTANEVNAQIGVVDIDVADISDPDNVLVGANAAQISLTGQDITTSSAAILNNTIEGIGTLNRSGSQIEINGTNNTNASSGIASSQVATASNLTVAINAEVLIDIDENVNASELTLAGNAQRAVGVGNLASNSIDTDVNDMTALNGSFLDDSGVLVPLSGFDDTTSSIEDANERFIPGSRATAGAAISNSQVITSINELDDDGGLTGDLIPSILSSSVDGPDAGFEIGVVGDVVTSSLSNDSNTALANIRGNAADNQISITGNDITTNGITVIGDPDTTTRGAEIAELNRPKPWRVQFDFGNFGPNGDPTSSLIPILEELAEEFGGQTNSQKFVQIFFDTEGEAEAFLAALASGPTFFTEGGNSYAFGTGGLGEPSAITQFETGIQESGTLAAVSNSQMFDADATATAMAEAGDTIATEVGDSVDGGSVESSQISTSLNAIEAQAVGNTAANGITVSANNLNTSGTPNENALAVVTLPADPTIDPTTAVSTAGLTVSSTQLATGSVRATLNTEPDGGGNGTGAFIETEVGGNVLDSSVRSDGNLLSASAVGNEVTTGTNLISVEGTNVATSTAVSNLQIMDADVSASALLGVTTSSVLEARGVTIEVDGVIERSLLSVDGNEVSGNVTGNFASNRIEAAATNLLAGGDLTVSSANSEFDSSAPDLTFVATADNALTNVQQVGSDPLAGPAPNLLTNVGAAFAIITEDPSTNRRVTDSSLSVSGNEQFATTRANVANNTIDLAATNMGADEELDEGDIGTGAALLSVQLSNATVTANSDVEVYAPAAILNSSLDMNDNRNQAVATMNTATNTVSVSGTNIESISGGSNAQLALDTVFIFIPTPVLSAINQTVEGDFVLNNIQSAETSVEARADTQLFNVDKRDGTTAVQTDGITNSTISVQRNVTVAEGTANLATNEMEITGGALFEGTSGVYNNQTSSAQVSASATTNAALDIEANLSADPIIAADSSSVEISGNGTSSRAIGNSASNILNASAVSFASLGHSAGSASSDVGAGLGGSVSATFAVLNAQTNIGDVAAQTTASYGATMRSNSDNASIVNSSFGVMGNTVQSTAAGNSVTNAVTVSALNQANSSAAVGSQQVNTGNISASISNSDMGVTSIGSGSVSGSQIGIGGNSMVSSATGNLANSSITRN